MKRTTERATTPWKVGIATVAVAGLSLMGLSPAYAETFNVTADEVQAFQVGGDTGSEAGYNYNEWHMGHTSPAEEALGEASFNFDDPAGITLSPNAVTGGTGSATQLFKGYHIADEIGTGATTFDKAGFLEFLNGVSVDLASGNEIAPGGVHLQIAGMYTLADESTGWTTLRPVDAHGSIVAGDPNGGNWTGTGSHFRTVNEPLADIVDGLIDFQVYGVGVVVDGNEDAVVSTISFGGDVYNFAAPVVTEDEDEEKEVDDSPTAPTAPVAVETAA